MAAATATTLDTISEALQEIDTKKENLKKAFEDLQTHSSLISSISLTWSDLESHFTSIQNSLTHKFQTLKTLNSQSSAQPPPPESNPPATPNRVDPRPELAAFCEKMDGLGLRKYLSETSRLGERSEIRAELPGAILRAPDPGELVLGAMEGFFKPFRENEKEDKYRGDKDIEMSCMRRSCVLLLEQLMAVCPNLGGGEVKGKAKRLAFEWRGRMSLDGKNPLESLGFLHLVAAYGLASEFDMDELLDMFVIAARYWQGTDLCRKIGLGDKVEGIIACPIQSFVIEKLDILYVMITKT